MSVEDAERLRLATELTRTGRLVAPVSLHADVPTHTDSSGTFYWRSEKGLHRLGGPAVAYPDGRREWWLDGKRLPCPE